MTRKKRNEIIRFAEKLTDEELEKEYYDAIDDCLGSLAEEMYELGMILLMLLKEKSTRNI